MYLIEIMTAEYQHTSYVCFTLDSVKQTMISLFDEWSPGITDDDICGWASLNDEIEYADSVDEINFLVNGFASDIIGGPYFRFHEIEDGQEIRLLN